MKLILIILFCGVMSSCSADVQQPADTQATATPAPTAKPTPVPKLPTPVPIKR